MNIQPDETRVPGLLDLEEPLNNASDLILVLLMAVSGSDGGFGDEKDQWGALIALARKIQGDVDEALSLWENLVGDKPPPRRTLASSPTTAPA